MRNERNTPKHHEILDKLKQMGLRMTPQREMVVAAICKTSGHLSAESLMTRLRKQYPYVNKSAVYRTLDLLTRVGAVNFADFGKGHLEYEVHYHPHHHHLFCESCRRTIEMDDEPLSLLIEKVRKKYKFVPSLQHLALAGLCGSCGRSRKSGARKGR